MRHRMDRRSLGRRGSHRMAMLENMSVSLILEERIETTVTRAKELRRVVEKMISKAKSGRLHDRRLVASKLPDKAAVKKLFDEIAGWYVDRNGGYTRITKTGFRKGDAAPMAVIGLVKPS